MKTIIRIDGLSASRKIINHIKDKVAKILKVARQTLLPGLIFCMALSACQKNSGAETADAVKEKAPKEDTLAKPRVNIQVNRRYDEKGNVIAFDSTYSTYYSNLRGDTLRMDSAFKQFDRYFGHSHSPFFNNEFNRLFFRDSMWAPDFFHKDFFMNRYEQNGPYMRNMMRRMDSIKNKYYRDKSAHSKEGKRS